MSQHTAGSLANAASISAMAGLSPHYQKQLELAQQARLSSSPHHHARQHATAARASILANANGSASGLNGNLAGSGLLAASTSSAIAITAPGGGPAANANGNNAAGNGTGNGNANGNTTTTNNNAENMNESRMSVASHTNGSAQQPSERASGWTSIDMGGMLIHNISKELFRYTFLTHLYLNHNNLISIPSEISKLCQLALLNLSGNKLSSIPAELGLVVSLKELLLFDNELTFLPPELGQLYQLETLGIEGNPLGEPIPSLLQKDGTVGVITYLRDMCPIGNPPADREWVVLEDETYGANAIGRPFDETCTVMCYNTLCEKYASPQAYAYTPSWALAWDYRKDLILQDILNYNADIVCLQEMEIGQFEDFFREQLSQLAEYDGVIYPKSRARTMPEFERRQVDGCATLYKANKFKLLEKHNIEFQQVVTQRPELRQCEDVLNRVMVKDNIAVVTFLEHKTTGMRYMVVNAHLHWDPAYSDVKLIQTALMIEEMDRLMSVWLKVHPTDPPNQVPAILLCGDLNSLPDSGVFEFLSRGQVSADHDDIRDFKYKPFTDGGLSHKHALKSAYAQIEDLGFTNFTPTFRGIIDYIWFSTNTFTVTGVLSHVDKEYVGRTVGFPNAHHPSDHIPLVASLRPRQPVAPSGPRKVNFNNK
ncbi:Endonuclease/exonuclease/phosphatase [Entophlyctis helioformis]|nr:Endonuclease/exonuclease/phosphatase [Entophlyctis helioformis]